MRSIEGATGGGATKVAEVDSVGAVDDQLMLHYPICLLLFDTIATVFSVISWCRYCRRYVENGKHCA